MCTAACLLLQLSVAVHTGLNCLKLADFEKGKHSAEFENVNNFLRVNSSPWVNFHGLFLGEF